MDIAVNFQVVGSIPNSALYFLCYPGQAAGYITIFKYLLCSVGKVEVCVEQSGKKNITASDWQHNTKETCFYLQ